MTKKRSASAGEAGAGGHKHKDESTEVSAQAVEEDINALRDRLKEKECEAQEYVSTLQRLQADFENYKKRLLKEKAEVTESAAKNLILELIPVVDNLERALGASKETEDFDALAKGVEMVHAQLLDVIKKAGVSQLDPHEQEFDPFHHEAVMQVESDEHPENTVVEVFQKGYLLKGKLLRAAVVKVSKASDGAGLKTED